MWRHLAQARWPWLTAALLIAAAYLSTFIEIRIGSDPRPVGSIEDIKGLSRRDDVNVLFVLIDTLRADRLRSWGNERETSPTIDSLAAAGVRFARQLSQSSWTKCSMASLWTGLYPVRTGVLRFDQVVSPAAKLPAEIFREAGFRTLGLWRNGWVAPNFGFSQGFEVYQRPQASPLRPSERRENPTLTLEGSDVDAVEAAVEFLRVHGQERWFLYLHLMDVHQYVYDEESAVFGTTYIDTYDQAILRINRVLDLLLAYLREEGLLEKTLIVLASDHGEAFGEHGSEGHARNVYAEVTEVPFILSFPFRLEPGIVVETRTENVDVWPTVLDLLGLPPLEDTDGHSLVPLILAAARNERIAENGDHAFAEIDQTWGRIGRVPAPMVSVTSGDFRFVRSSEPPVERLFDRRDDALERHDVLSEQPEVAERLREAAISHLERSPPPPWGQQTPALELDEMELNQLRALGYGIR